VTGSWLGALRTDRKTTAKAINEIMLIAHRPIKRDRLLSTMTSAAVIVNPNAASARLTGRSRKSW
jgi:hypothetical protein